MASHSRCATHDLWDGLGNHIYAYLHGISLRDVCAGRLPADARFALPTGKGAAGEASVN